MWSWLTDGTGLDVYEEIHQDYWNKLIHFAFLPGVFYGAFRGVPALIGASNPGPVVTGMSFAYGIYYALAHSIYAGVGTMIYTVPFAFLAVCHTVTRNNHVRESFCVALWCLLFQEMIGHTLLEETNSRLTVEYVTNAIIYSPLFYTSCVIKLPILYLFQLMTVLKYID